LAAAVTARIKALHSYEVPEAIVLSLDENGGNFDYMQWVATNTLPKAL